MLRWFTKTKDHLQAMHAARDLAEREGIAYLESQAVAGTISRAMVERVADTLRMDPAEIIAMTPNRHNARRHSLAMAGLRKANLADLSERRDREHGRPYGQ